VSAAERSASTPVSVRRVATSSPSCGESTAWTLAPVEPRVDSDCRTRPAMSPARPVTPVPSWVRRPASADRVAGSRVFSTWSSWTGEAVRPGGTSAPSASSGREGVPGFIST
jgi:hypothetical protein